MRSSRALLVTVALVGCSHDRAPSDEDRAREAWVHDLAVREGVLDAWSLTSRSDLLFEDGLGPVENVDPLVTFAGCRTETHRCDSGATQRVRWMGPRSHLRVRGDADMRLEIRGRVELGKVQTRPFVTATFAGEEIHAAPVGAEGAFEVRTMIPRGRLTGWRDLYITLSSVSEPWRDPAVGTSLKLTAARLEQVVWEPVVTGRTE